MEKLLVGEDDWNGLSKTEMPGWAVGGSSLMICLSFKGKRKTLLLNPTDYLYRGKSSLVSSWRLSKEAVLYVGTLYVGTMQRIGERRCYVITQG